MENLTNLQELFQEYTFIVPDYQRGYAWEKSNVEDLLDDLDSLYVKKQHYTGTIILLPSKSINGLGKSYSQCDVVDGQQRLTTLTILVKSIVKILQNDSSDYDKEDKEGVINNLTSTYLWEKIKGGKVFKLTLQDSDDHFLKERILNESIIEFQTASQKRLLSASQVIYEHLLEKSKQTGYIRSLIDKLSKSPVFTLYKVTDETEVGIIFETMNDRGVSLRNLDKVKNHLLYLANKTASEDKPSDYIPRKIIQSWSNILRNLYVNDLEELEEDQLLQISIILKFYNTLENIKENGKTIKSINSQLSDGYRLIKDHFKAIFRDSPEKCYTELGNYAAFLEELSEKYRDIKLPNHPRAFASVTDLEIRDRIKLSCDKYNRIGGQVAMIPLMVAIYIKYLNEPRKIADLFELIEKIGFNMYGLSESRPHSARDKFHSTACELFNGTFKKDLVSELRDIGVNYSYTIAESLTDPKRDYYDWRWIKYFLYEYEIWRCKKSSKGSPSLPWDNFDKTDKDESIEHILPQTYPERVPYWTDRFSRDVHEVNYKKIGNLTLTNQNQHLSNKGFDEKKVNYKKSSWQIERDLAEKYQDWNEENIGKREEELIKFAEKRWEM